MEEMELKKIKELFMQLSRIVRKYGKSQYRIQLESIDHILECIESDITLDQKIAYILRKYKLLYPPYGGLSEFYIHSDDFKERLRLNEPLDKINDELWQILKEYE